MVCRERKAEGQYPERKPVKPWNTRWSTLLSDFEMTPTRLDIAKRRVRKKEIRKKERQKERKNSRKSVRWSAVPDALRKCWFECDGKKGSGPEGVADVHIC